MKKNPGNNLVKASFVSLYSIRIRKSVQSSKYVYVGNVSTYTDEMGLSIL